MKVWSAIFNLFAVVIMMFIAVMQLYTYKTYQRNFEQARLNLTVDYAAEAAFKTTINSNDNGLDYTNMNNIGINPSNCIDIFDRLICYNYNLSVSDENYKAINNSITAMVLSADDGYYIAQTVYDTTRGSTDGEQYGLHWSTKQPYMLERNNKIYLVNITNKTFKIVDKSNGWSESTKKLGDSVIGDSLSVNEAMQVVNDSITNSIIQEINQKSLSGSAFEYKFQLPIQTTKSGVNPIKGPGLIVLMNKATFMTSEDIKAISVSGYQTKEKTYIVAYRENGKKYYCYDGQLTKDELSSSLIDNYYSTMQAAAKAGYYPDYVRMTRGITKR